ncbi:MAG: MerR family transcriptional regulator [Desulfamplus sp.]
MYSIKELSKLTNLDISFIRKCKNTFKQIIEPHIQRGEKNKLIFTDNALVIFDRIAQMKKEGLSISEIQKQFKHDFKTVQTGVSKDVQTGVQAAQTVDKELLDKIFQLQKQLSEEQAKRYLECKERDQKIFELETLNHHLADTLKLLPEGKTPEQLKQEWHVEQEKKDKALKIVAKLKNENSSGLFGIFRRKNKQLIDELENTMMTSQVPENPLQE